MTKIYVHSIGAGGPETGECFEVRYEHPEGPVLFESTDSPFTDTCRALQLSGESGHLEMWMNDKLSMSGDIDRWARVRAQETPARPLDFVRYKRFPGGLG